MMPLRWLFFPFTENFPMIPPLVSPAPSVASACPSALYVGYVLKRYPRFSETFVVNEILAHEREGMKIDIFALGPVSEAHFQDGISQVRAPVTRYSDKQRNPESFWQIVRQAEQQLPGLAQHLPEALRGSVHECAQALLLAMAVRERGIQHLHAHFGTQATTVARLAALFSGVGYTFTAHAKDIYYQYEESTALDQKMRDAASTITVSDYNLAYLRQQYGADAARAVRIYNGMDLRKFPASDPAQVAQRAPHVLAVGRLVPKKGFEVLVDAVRLLKERGVAFHCTLVGEGDLREALAARMAEQGVQDCMTLTGAMPQPDIIRLLRQAAVMVAPCVISADGDRDGLPTVLLEAMALGTPVISTQVAGIPELVVDGETGLCIPPQDPALLAQAIESLLADAQRRSRFSHQARALIERDYDIDRNAAVQRQVFRRAVESHTAQTAARS
jgi:glycosyltransferase involved in cell wall biosynthesis